CEIVPENFHHREHVRVAYILLTRLNVKEVFTKLKNDLLSFLDFIGAGKSIYHETLTYSWLLTVNHFMYISSPAESFNEFINANKILLNKESIYTDYSHTLIESDEARSNFLKPDLEPIPIHEKGSAL
ncbi:MAG: hypothetical protein GWO07_11820, partial [Candidatus Dadabacteria bacterium]|nr:hypothetical protein [Candidatus Dadabacteria bacterium]NIS09426.1 hypothetical protein [Candidatus Dadabacteria bacterium]NIY22664.1 hypothetical protein [Candidatus Dadabacteria bacterium]